MKRQSNLCHLILLLFIIYAIIYGAIIFGNRIEANALLAGGSTLYVGGAGPNNYTKIQYAIDNASEGDTIFVYEGIYHESLMVKSSLQVVGENEQKTIIIGNDDEYTVLLEGVTSEITGFTIKGGEWASGIKITGGHNIVTHCDVIGMWCGIYFRHSSFNIVTNCSFNDNSYCGVIMIECPDCGHYSHKNTLYHNNFIVPNMKAFSRSLNFWDNGKEGNYWIDYTGKDEDGDGIGDEPYNILGGGGQDRYPLMKPIDYIPPNVTIMFPNGGEILSGKVTVKWSVSDNCDSHPVCEIKYSDDAGINWHTIATRINGSEYEWDTTHLVPGENYFLQITATDNAGNMGKDAADGKFTVISPPSVTIIKPKDGYLYVLDRAILPLLKNTIIIGKILVEADASSEIGIDAVNFYIDGNFRKEVKESPYSWLWDEATVGKRSIKVVVYDNAGGMGSDEQETWIFNL